ncbi:MAG: thioredoxin family protein [Planctomycetes bacterium]|nr:thioredoxin family protein [Planctomycetota bacterium]
MLPKFPSLSRFLPLFACLIALSGLTLANAAPPEATPSKTGSKAEIPDFTLPDEPERAEKVIVTLAARDTTVSPGSSTLLAVTFDHAPKWHVHTNAPAVPAAWKAANFEPFPTVVTLEPDAGLKVSGMQWPRPVEILADLAGTGKAEKYGVFEGKATVFLVVNVDASATPGPRPLKVNISYQACDDTKCQLPVETSLTSTFTIGAPTVAATPADPVFSSFKPELVQNFIDAAPGSGAKSTVRFDVLGKSFEVDTKSGAGFALLLLASALGGFLLNLTPCVLPVIPIKMIGLSHEAGSRSRSLLLGTIMFAGVVFFWLVIAILIASIKSFTATNQLFQIPWVSIGIGIFVAIMGLGMLGLFTFNLPNWVYSVDPKRDSIGGSFVFGIMTAVLATPCTAPFGGAAMAWAATQSPAIILAVFAAIGVGMALPYFILAAFPKLVSWVPKSGPASELLKQVLGLLLFAVAIYFIGVGIDPLLREPVDEPIRFFWWLVAAVVVGAMLWMIFRTIKITSSLVRRSVFTILGLAFSVGIVGIARAFTDHGPIRWVGYTPERLAKYQAEGKVVVMDFTAEWCFNCKLLESNVLHTPEIVELLSSDGIVPMKIDLTGNNKPGAAKLKELGWVSIPLLAISGPTRPDPIKMDWYTVDDVKKAIQDSTAAIRKRE